MKISYSAGVITLDCNDRRETVDYIFGRSDGLELVKFHMNELLTQRQLQKDHEEKETVISKLTPEEIQSILDRK